jgi:hypothetical protein
MRLCASLILVMLPSKVLLWRFLCNLIDLCPSEFSKCLLYLNGDH